LDISSARNPVPYISFDGKSEAKSFKYGALKFHIPVKASWDYEANKSHISINALIDTVAEDIIFNADFVVQMIMPYVKREKRLTLEAANGSLHKRSGI